MTFYKDRLSWWNGQNLGHPAIGGLTNLLDCFFAAQSTDFYINISVNMLISTIIMINYKYNYN